jgi:hypothetical protein
MKNTVNEINEGDALNILEKTVAECAEWQEKNEKESQEFLECLSVEPKRVVHVYFALNGPNIWAELHIGRDGYPTGGTLKTSWYGSTDSADMTEAQAIQIFEAYGVEANLEHQVLFRK